MISCGMPRRKYQNCAFQARQETFLLRLLVKVLYEYFLGLYLNKSDPSQGAFLHMRRLQERRHKILHALFRQNFCSTCGRNKHYSKINV